MVEEWLGCSTLSSSAVFGKFIADLATTVNAMCYHEERYHIGRFNALLDGYQSERTLSLAEWDAFPNELRFSAFRFTLTRLRDFFFRHMDEKRRVNKDYRGILSSSQNPPAGSGAVGWTRCFSRWQRAMITASIKRSTLRKKGVNA